MGLLPSCPPAVRGFNPTSPFSAPTRTDQYPYGRMELDGKFLTARAIGLRPGLRGARRALSRGGRRGSWCPRARRTSRARPARPIATASGSQSTTLPTSRQPPVPGELDDRRDERQRVGDRRDHRVADDGERVDLAAPSCSIHSTSCAAAVRSRTATAASGTCRTSCSAARTSRCSAAACQNGSVDGLGREPDDVGRQHAIASRASLLVVQQQ